MLIQSGKELSVPTCWLKVLAALVLVVLPTSSWGHFVNQIYAELGGAPQAASIGIQFDAGSATREQPNDLLAPHPKRSWLFGLPREEQLVPAAAAA